MRVAILPSGALLADAPRGGDEAGDGLSGVARARVARAFARGPGHALLDLGSTELDAPLVPPLAFLRDVGRAFVTSCSVRPPPAPYRARARPRASASPTTGCPRCSGSSSRTPRRLARAARHAGARRVHPASPNGDVEL
jgi:hypothetical protein